MPTNSRNRLAIIIELLLIGIVVVLLFSSISSMMTSSTTPTVPAQRLDAGPAPEVPRVSVSDAYAAYQAKQAVFVDARTAEQYEASHIPGAKLILVNELEGRLKELNPEQWIITYCT